MQTHERDIDRFLKAGATQDVAETLSNMIANYKANHEIFDDEYWEWKLEHVGMSEDEAQFYVALIRKPSLIKYLVD